MPLAQVECSPCIDSPPTIPPRPSFECVGRVDRLPRLKRRPGLVQQPILRTPQTERHPQPRMPSKALLAFPKAPDADGIADGKRGKQRVGFGKQAVRGQDHLTDGQRPVTPRFSNPPLDIVRNLFLRKSPWLRIHHIPAQPPPHSWKCQMVLQHQLRPVRHKVERGHRSHDLRVPANVPPHPNPPIGKGRQHLALGGVNAHICEIHKPGPIDFDRIAHCVPSRPKAVFRRGHA